MELADLMVFGGDQFMAEIYMRCAMFLVGAAGLVHFGCMAIVTEGHKASWLDAVFAAGVAASGFLVAYTAAFGALMYLLEMVGLFAGVQLLFWLRLWTLGFHVSAFLRDRHDAIDVAKNPRG